MAIAFVQGAGNHFGAGTVTTLAATLSAVASGSTVAGAVSWDNVGGACTLTNITDDKGNTYNQETAVVDAGNGQTAVAFSLSNITNAPTVITGHWGGTAGGGKSIIADEFSGCGTATTDQRDSTAHGGQLQSSPGTGSNAVTSGNFTTATNGDLLYGVTANDGGDDTTVTAGTGFALTGTSSGVASNNAAMLKSEWQAQTTAGSSTAATFTITPNQARVTFLIAIKAAVAAVPQGWENIDNDIFPPRPAQFVAPPAIALTPATLPVPIRGMAWFEPPDRDRPTIKINGESPPAYDARPPQVPISGMGWFEPRDIDKLPKGSFFTDPTAVPFILQIITWSFAVSDTVWLRDPPKDVAPAIGYPPTTTPVGISGMAWFEPWDRDKIATKVRLESPPAIQLIPGTLPTPVSGIAWFEPLDRNKPTTKVTLESPPGQTLLPPLLISQIQGMAWFTPLDYARPIQTFSQSVAYVALPPAAVPISGMAWFEPWDRDKIAIKVTLEALPAIQLIPGTLPAPISGMAWFQPWPNIVKLWPGQSEPPAFEQPIVQLPPPPTGVDVDIPREVWRKYQKRLKEIREARERQDKAEERIKQVRRTELRKAFERASGAISEAIEAAETAPMLTEAPDVSALSRDLVKIISETRMPQALRKTHDLTETANQIRRYYEELREEDDLEAILLALQ